MNIVLMLIRMHAVSFEAFVAVTQIDVTLRSDHLFFIFSLCMVSGQ